MSFELHPRRRETGGPILDNLSQLKVKCSNVPQKSIPVYKKYVFSAAGMGILAFSYLLKPGWCRVAVACVKVLTGLLYGVAPIDSGTFAVMGAALVAVSVAASLLAAIGVLRLTPGDVLRQE